MPLVKETNEPVTPAPVVPTTVPKPYFGVTVDTRYTPQSSLLTFVAGSAWTVDYFSQVVDIDNELSPQQTARAGVYQQYCKINRMELKVTQALTASQDSQSKVMTVTGAATMYPGVIPNFGDMFVADSNDGRLAIFTVTASNKMSILKDAAYTIEYQLVDYYEGVRKADLDKKVVKDVYFVKDYLLQGRNPYLIDQDYQRMGDFAAQFRRLLNDYLGTFFSYEHQCLLIPDQSCKAYDPFLTAKFMNWIGPEDHPLVARIRQLNVGGDQAMRMPTVWDALEAMDGSILPTAVQKMILMDTCRFKDYPQFSSIYFTGVRRVIYPNERRTDVDRSYTRPEFQRAGYALNATHPRWNTLERILTDTTVGSLSYTPASTDASVLPDIHRITDTGDYYLFTRAFYYPGSAPFASKIEQLVYDALCGKALDSVTLAHLAQTALQWENLERFYFIPMLLALLKCALIRGS